tara:strand:+ start:4869 stop:5201 length:333 start_codon:yes stop_codon:yes gene_type:complete
MSKVSPINHPSHYNVCDPLYETINVIEAWGLGFNDGNAIKYIARAMHKGKTIEDYEKAIWYLEREVQKLLLKKGSKIPITKTRITPTAREQENNACMDRKPLPDDERIGW